MGLANKLQGAPAAAPGGAMPSTAANQMPSAPAGYPQPSNPVSMHMPPAQLPAGQTPMGHNMPYGAPSAPPAPVGAPPLSSNNPFAPPAAATGMPGSMPPPHQQQMFGNPLAPQQPFGMPPQQQQHQQQTSSFGMPPQQQLMGARPPATNSYMQPPQQQPYGMQPPHQQQPYGMPPQQQQQPYGMPPQQQQMAPGFAGPGAGPGATPAAAGGGAVGGTPAPMGAPGGLAGALLNKLQSIVAVNQLQRFYNPQSLQALANRLDTTVNFRDLAARWRMPLELAVDLASLALYDIIMFCDDSGSMAFEENGERIDDLKLIASKVAEVATLFDQDGILLRFMNSPVEGNGIRSTAEVAALLANVQYAGLTPLATALQQKVLQPVVYNLANQGQLQKPVLVITITDGEPTDNPRDLVVQVIKEARQRLYQYGPKSIAFQFAQVGKDQRAQAFLNRLDTNPEVGGSIDCTSYFELEAAQYQQKGITLSPEMWLVKMMCGSVDPTYDEADE